ncbi:MULTISPECIES: GNAT family N-acetyltransferase [Flavobacterium]|uniref:Ribosomal protein S18 acetylase RimI-like enzyme n=1 Tax=Flavobacterium weaverense TaxID=271156 RepID=A0A3L9ZXW6_9FLAO|nr:GNAT family N-acetyltransferase [Flavobacterium weaverense]RMA77286.1 ribosomal protein S18 acetylase RimI-like enzyme [Flavobacterium weaverense]
MNIRKGNRNDMQAVLDLIQELAEFENEPDAVLVTVDDLVRDGFGPTPLFQVLVAEIDDDANTTSEGKQIVGMALYYHRFSTWKGKTIHLEDLVVKEKMRGTGLGYALYSEILKQGKKDGVRRVEWNVLDWNTPAIEFYKKSGAKIMDGWLVVQMDEQGINEFVDNKLK